MQQHEGAGWAYTAVRGVAGRALARPLCISQCSNLPLCSLSVKLKAVGVASLQPQSFIQHTHSSVLQLYLIHLQTDRWRDRWRDRWVSRDRWRSDRRRKVSVVRRGAGGWRLAVGVIHVVYALVAVADLLDQTPWEAKANATANAVVTKLTGQQITKSKHEEVKSQHQILLGPSLAPPTLPFVSRFSMTTCWEKANLKR